MIFAVCRWWFDIPFAGSLALALWRRAPLCGEHRGAGAHDFRLGADTAAVGCSMLHSAAPFTRPLRLMTPTAAMPEWMQTITILNPVRYGILVVRMIYFENAGISEVAPYLWPMALIAAASVPGAVWLFGRKVA